MQSKAAYENKGCTQSWVPRVPRVSRFPELTDKVLGPLRVLAPTLHLRWLTWWRPDLANDVADPDMFKVNGHNSLLTVPLVHSD
jgi:hypothetical protein